MSPHLSHPSLSATSRRSCDAQFLDASPVVERYAWFTDRWGADPTISLLKPNASELTPTGQVRLWVLTQGRWSAAGPLSSPRLQRRE